MSEVKQAFALVVRVPILIALGALSIGAHRARQTLTVDSSSEEAASGASSVASFHDRYMKRLDETAKSIYRTLRNVFDRAVALVALAVLSPILLLTGLMIRADSTGPALFRQQRIGIRGKPFTMLKFRTLHEDAPPFSLKLSEHDATITQFGALLRRSGLDELPQLWNVLRGEMALIGPRPEQCELINIYEPWQRQRETIRPGITGWWQIHHRDGEPLHRNVDKDLYYIHHQGPWIDLLIVLGTLRIVFGALLNVGLVGRRALQTPTVDLEAEKMEGVQRPGSFSLVERERPCSPTEGG